MRFLFGSFGQSGIIDHVGGQYREMPARNAYGNNFFGLSQPIHQGHSENGYSVKS